MINDIDKELNNEILWRYKELKNISRLFEKHTKKELINGLRTQARILGDLSPR